MAALNIPIGISDFEKIRENGYYFIDKSRMIEELLKNATPEVMLITRPRRFGKTLGMSMLASFFDIRKDSMEMWTAMNLLQRKICCETRLQDFFRSILTWRTVIK